MSEAKYDYAFFADWRAKNGKRENAPDHVIQPSDNPSVALATVRQCCSIKTYRCQIEYPQIPDGIHVVYYLIDPRDGEVFYVGRTKKFKKRMQAHCVLRPPAADDWGTFRLHKRKAEIFMEGLAIIAYDVRQTNDPFWAEFSEYHLTAKHADTVLNTQIKRWDRRLIRPGTADMQNRFIADEPVKLIEQE